MPSLSWIQQLPSLAVFTSWQCLCSSCRLSHLSLPSNDTGLIWSTSQLSSFLNVSPHCWHFPFCFLSSMATLLFNSGLFPNFVLQYVRFPSYGLAGPFTFTCLIISTLLCRNNLISPSSVLYRNRHFLSSPKDQYFLAIQSLC